MPELVYEEKQPGRQELRAILVELQEEVKAVPRENVVAVSQVAEKAWMAFVTYVKASSPVPIRSYAGVIDQVQRLTHDDKGIQNLWFVADSLHRFRYAPFVEDLRGGLQAVIQAALWVHNQVRNRSRKL